MPTKQEIKEQRRQTIDKMHDFMTDHGRECVLVGLNSNPETNYGTADGPLLAIRSNPAQVKNFGADFAIPGGSDSLIYRRFLRRLIWTWRGPSGDKETYARICKYVHDIDGVRLDWK